MSQNLLKLATTALSVSVDPVLATPLLEQAKEIETAFSLKKWKYSQLDGGRFCEVAARIIYAADSGTVNATKSVESCIAYIENDTNTHNYSDRQALLHIAKIIKAAYKLRSQRGAVHVTPKYTADELDSRFILECCRWVLSDILRLFAGTSKSEVVELIKELAKYPVPLVRSYGGNILVQHTGFTAQEEVLAILYYGPKEGMKLNEIIKATPKDQSGVRKAVKYLAGAKSRQLVYVGEHICITDLGVTAIEKTIKEKVHE